MQGYRIRHGHKRVATRWVSNDPVNNFPGAEIKPPVMGRLALKTGSSRTAWDSVARMLLRNEETVKVPNCASHV